MENADNLLTKEQTDVDFEKSPSQLHFEELLEKIRPTRGLSVFVKWYITQADSPVYKQHSRTVSDRIRHQLNRNQVADIDRHLPFLIRYCQSKGVDCGSVSEPDFMINNLHDDPTIAREIFEALSNLDWSNECEDP